jgi:hypothetical protein
MNFKESEDLNVKIWRYMNFEKYVSMLQTKSLYFARLHQLEDPYEGSYLPAKILKSDFQHEEVDEKLKSSIKYNAKQQNLRMAVNCWHMSDCESAAMWKIYSNQNKAVAIQSTFDLLKKGMNSSVFGKRVKIGVVRYLDYDNELFSDDAIGLYYGVISKRKEFEYEKEVRAVIYTPEGSKPDVTINDGFPVKIDLNMLIEKVYVSPTADDWFLNLVRLESKTYDCIFEVNQSPLYKRPGY